jgi:FecR protein
MGQIRNSRFLAFTVTVLALAGAVLPARAQDADDLKRGVARLSLINGEVSVRRGDAGEWVAGVINAPLLTDDHIATGPNSRTELQFDADNVLRLGANAELRLTQVEYGRYQLDLARGVMTYRVLRNVNANIEIDTPSLAVRPSREGSVRISVNEAGETEVTARGGDVEIFNPRGSQWLRNGQTMLARGSSSDPEFQIVNAGGPDEWDRWCDGRDRMILQSVSARYVGQGVYGAEDMDAAGTWTNVPEYGNVWYPTGVPAGWAPYQSGRWVWQDWYGWTWVSYDPWGWAPYHYGRWFHNDRFGWCWYPGVFGARHYWSPALVAFVGFGGGGGFGFGFGNIGWVPLAPYEVFHPWWGRGFYGANRFNRTVNITNVNITNTYRNARFNNAISAVRVNDFQSGRFNSVSRFNGNQIGQVGAVHGGLPLAPSNNSTRFTDRQASVVPRATANTRFFRQQQPSMTQQQSAVRGGQAPAAQDNGWRRFGTPAGQGASPQAGQQPMNRGGASAAPAPRNDRPAAAAPQNGWQRFGSPAPGQAQRQAAPAPRQNYPQQNNAPVRNQYMGGSNQQSLHIAPPVVRERPAYSAPQRQSAPSYSAPRQSAPSYSAPRQSAPSYSAPRQSAPSAPRQSAPRQGGSNNSGNHGGRSR